MRTEDKEIYLAENRYNEPKEATKFILHESKRWLVSGSKVADIGCAAGEFLYHLGKTNDELELHGFDLLPELIEKARLAVPFAKFQTGSILDSGMISSRSFDVIYVQGVLSIFDDIAPIIRNLIHWCKPGGRIFIFGMLNEFDVDILMKYQKTDFSHNHWEKGWNLFSQTTYKKLVHEAGANVESFKKFDIPIDIPYSGDPARTWTTKQLNGSRQIRNGLGQIVDLYLTEISVK